MLARDNSTLAQRLPDEGARTPSPQRPEADPATRLSRCLKRPNPTNPFIATEWRPSTRGLEAAISGMLIGSSRRLRVYAFPAPVDMRKGFDGLAA